MTEPSRLALDTARNLLAAALPVAVSEPTGDHVAVAERTVTALAEVLTRWFGPYGYHALLNRALAQTRAAHPALADVRPHSIMTPVLEGLSDAAAAHGAGPLIEGVFALLTALVGLLGRVVGDEMALQLLERSMPALGGPGHPNQRSDVPEEPTITGGPIDGANR